MARRVLFPLLLAVLLLAGQQVALVHSVWHLGKHGPVKGPGVHATAQNHPSEGKSSQSRLCDLHAALGTLLSGDCGSLPASVAIESSLHPAIHAAAWRIAQSATTPPSRAPPVFL